MLLTYRSSGTDSTQAAPIVLLNAMGLDADDWGTFPDLLLSRRRTIAISRRGHGDSSYATPARFEDFADDVIETLDELGVERFDVVGISMGGCEALDLAVRYSPRVASLTAINTFAHVSAEERRTRLEGLDAAYATTTPHEYAQMLLRGMIHAPLAREQYCRLEEAFAEMPRHVFRELMVALYRIDLLPRLPEISSPTRVLGSEFDTRTTPDRVRELAARIPAATFDVIDDAGHFPHLEQPTTFGELLTRLYSTGVDDIENMEKYS